MIDLLVGLDFHSQFICKFRFPFEFTLYSILLDFHTDMLYFSVFVFDTSDVAEALG